MIRTVGYICICICLIGIGCQPQPTTNTTDPEVKQLASTAQSLSSNTKRDVPLNNRLSPLKRSAGTIGRSMTILSYGSPAIKGRIVWGALVPYGEIWRTGANEATHIRFDQDMLIEGQPLAAGDYALFTIPTRDDWTIIFNSNWKSWGTEYDASTDALRVKVPFKKVRSIQEELSIDVLKDGILIAWDKLEVKVNMTDQPVETSEVPTS